MKEGFGGRALKASGFCFLYSPGLCVRHLFDVIVLPAMKRCPSCQSIYTDDSLSYCLQDGSKLSALRDSASSDEVTWQISGERGTDLNEPPPTEVLRPEDMPTARMEPTALTIEQQRARLTALDQHQRPSGQGAVGQTDARRGNGAVIALTITVAILLVALGGLITWVMLRDKGQAITSANSNAGSNTGSNDRSSGRPGDMAAGQREIQDLLNAWVDSIRRRELDQHMGYYADVLEFYYSATNVSRDRVRADRSAAFTKYSSMEMQLSNMRILVDPSGRRATATFDKTFKFSGGEKDFSGSGLNRFSFEKVGASWRITGEKEIKTYDSN